jgi:hypothetical protein
MVTLSGSSHWFIESELLEKQFVHLPFVAQGGQPGPRAVIEGHSAFQQTDFR